MSHLNPPSDKEVREWKNKAQTLDELLQWMIESYEWELLELIGEDRCIKHFNLKLHQEEYPDLHW